MSTPAEIKRAALSYTTNRNNFLKKHKGSLHHKYLDMLFLHSGTRPDLAEQIPLWVLGHRTIPGTHDFDGERIDDVPVECKTQNIKDVTKITSGFGCISINDISQTIIDKYDEEQPEILFSFFIEGHLIAIFEIPWEALKPRYEAVLEKTGRKCIKITRFHWQNFCTLRFKNKNATLINDLVPKKFKELLSR